MSNIRRRAVTYTKNGNMYSTAAWKGAFTYDAQSLDERLDVYSTDDII